jgi:hypothetical protein
LYFPMDSLLCAAFLVGLSKTILMNDTNVTPLNSLLLLSCMKLTQCWHYVRGCPSFSFPPLPSSSTPPVHVYIPHTPVTSQYHLQGLYPKLTTFIPKGLTTFQRSTHQMSSTFSLFPRSYLKSTGWDSDALGQVCVTLWHPPLII